MTPETRPPRLPRLTAGTALQTLRRAFDPRPRTGDRYGFTYRIPIIRGLALKLHAWKQHGRSWRFSWTLVGRLTQNLTGWWHRPLN